MLAVSCGSWRRERALTMTIIVRDAFESCLLPENLAAFAIQADDLKGLFMIRPDAIGMKKLFVTVHVFDGLRARHNRPFNRRGEKYPVSPDYGRRMASAGYRCFPFDVPGGAPVGREVFLGGG